MKPNEIRKFEIDKTLEPKCQILPFIDDEDENRIEIDIKKMADLQQFRLYDNLGVNGKAYITCTGGFVSHMSVSGNARECGIGKIFMKLCLNEVKIHNVADNNKNRALEKLKEYATKPPILPNARVMEYWVKSKCEKFIYLLMLVEPASVPHLYLNSAIESGFTKMFIALKSEFYPKEGPFSVEALKQSVTDDGYMKNKDGTDVRTINNERVYPFGKLGFFCKPKTHT